MIDMVLRNRKRATVFPLLSSLLVCHKARNTVDENIFRLCGVQTLSTLVETRGVEPLTS